MTSELFFWKCSVKKVLLKFRKINKVAGLGPGTLLKRDSDTGVFHGILRNFQKHLFI